MRVDHRLLVDFPNAFDGAHEVGVLAQQVPRMRRFDVLLGIDQAPACFAQQAQLRFGQHAAEFSSFALQPQKALVTHHQSQPLPHTAHRRRRSADADEFQLLADADVAVRGILLGHLQDFRFQFRRRLVGHARFAPRLRGQPLSPPLLVGFLDLVEVTAGDACFPTDQRDILQLLG